MVEDFLVTDPIDVDALAITAADAVSELRWPHRVLCGWFVRRQLILNRRTRWFLERIGPVATICVFTSYAWAAYGLGCTLAAILLAVYGLPVAAACFCVVVSGCYWLYLDAVGAGSRAKRLSHPQQSSAPVPMTRRTQKATPAFVAVLVGAAIAGVGYLSGLPIEGHNACGSVAIGSLFGFAYYMQLKRRSR